MFFALDGSSPWPQGLTTILRDGLSTLRQYHEQQAAIDRMRQGDDCLLWLNPPPNPFLAARDRILDRVRSQLIGTDIVGWHCTRLCDDEIAALQTIGMFPLSPTTFELRLQQRVNADAAIRFFAEHGFEGQTRELAKRVGIAHSAIYRHFPSKDALIERVYEHVYVSRWNPYWETIITDSSRPLEDRLVQFYREYAERIFDYDWVRIFVFSGLRSYNITGRYLAIIRDKLVIPACLELRKEHRLSIPQQAPVSEREEEAIWGLHGQIFYIAIRKFVYGMPTPENLDQTIVDHVKRFIRGATIA